MASLHRLEYSKSTRSKCHGPICKGASMAPGSLRYGRITRDSVTLSENVEWRHWGCVTSHILAELAALIEDVPGFTQLTRADQQKIRVALAARRVAASDILASADPIVASISASASTTIASRPTIVNPRKRKGPGSNVPTCNTASSSQNMEVDVAEDEPMEEEEVQDELIVSMKAQVVGLQYYKGLVGPGEEVILVREPNNIHDRNAIRVDNIGHTQVGHIPRSVAAKLAPLMDSRAITVEGVMYNGNLSGFRGYSLDMTLKMYGPSDKVAQLQPRLVWATPGQRGFKSPGATAQAGNRRTTAKDSGGSRTPADAAPAPGSSSAQLQRYEKQQEALRKAVELRDMLNTMEKVNDQGRRSSLLDTLCTNEDILTLPAYESSPSIANGQLKVDLLKHQRQGLKWCLEHEYPELPKKEGDKPVQFWQVKKNGNKTFYLNRTLQILPTREFLTISPTVATNTPQEAPPTLGKGALFADAMGLGKTLTMISLIIATKDDVPKNFSNATLVVVPLSVLSNWEKQIQDHCVENTLTYCSYYGSQRAQLDARHLSSYDVVFTTYQTVAGEHESPKNQPVKKKKKAEKALFDVKWKRIVLDEGHSIRNPKAKMSQAVCALEAERRWILTGTPIINSPRDLGSLLTFLRICHPLDKEDFYKRLLLRPLKDGNPSGAELLRVRVIATTALMSHICLRRTKEMQDSAGNPLVPLPPVEMIKVQVTLNDEARSLYEEVEQLSGEKFEALMNGGSHAMMQSNALSMLTRMRQLALHPALLPRDYLDQLKQIDVGKSNHIEVTPEVKQRLQARLSQAIEECEECPICFSVPAEAEIKITSCSHVFCFPCIKESITRDSKCPMDRRALSLNDLHDPLPPMDMTQPSFRSQGDEMEEGLRNASSAKIEQLVQLLKLTPSGEKSLVFSQFTVGNYIHQSGNLAHSWLQSFLDKIAEVFEERGIPYVRFDGQMSAKRRADAITRFSVPLERMQAVKTSAAPGSRRASRKTSYNVSEGDRNDNEDDEDFGIDDGQSDFETEVTVTRKNKGKGKAKQTQGDSDFEDDLSFESIQNQNNPAVMLISLKAGALGLNLTVANNVYLMDPWWQEGIESQAIDRVNRIGQTKPVHVYQLIAENTVESKVLEIQDRKKKLIKEAFSGVKRRETERQHREARLQDFEQPDLNELDLIELFGVRQQEATQRAASQE
ncbi:SNF2 family N-terminal domain-containing protein [Lentinula guzmanii]|uniref:SNF2 family N-terminal domain-containing protein n=1 Tax=Lentinula guzmanii TaxID=2804957 RepID=A0AA38JBS7_9AGAR|nr:SNF2 family N-terminal domain-containing protein [Lentinula guzmanii]